MKTKFTVSELLEQVLDNMINLNEQLEQARSQQPSCAPERWLDAQDVTEQLHISPRTLQTLRSNGTLGYSRIGNKLYFRASEIEQLLRNNYVMFKLSALGKGEER